MLFPPELMGAHIGPPVSHTTRRAHDLSFRAAVALTGHLGIEWNLLKASPSERELIAEVFARHLADPDRADSLNVTLDAAPMENCGAMKPARVRSAS